MMFDFRDIMASTKAEQIRAWSVEQAIESMSSYDPIPESIVYRAALIEDFVLNGKKSEHAS